MIVDKHIDLNVYKDGTDLLNEDQLKIAGGKAGVGENIQQSCCGAGNTAAPEEKKSGCGIATASGAELSKLIADTDFNDWVGECLILCPYFLMIG